MSRQVAYLFATMAFGLLILPACARKGEAGHPKPAARGASAESNPRAREPADNQIASENKESPAPRGVKAKAENGFTYFEGVTYGHAGGVSLKLDLAVPEGEGPFPAIVCVHGGAWHSGSRGTHAQRIRNYARHGYVAATIDYRLAPRAHFPAPIQDVKCAVRWLRAHAGEYHIEKDHIGALGDSAGGHLVCLLGTTAGKRELEGNGGNAEESSAVQCVVALYPPTDLTMLHDLVGSIQLPKAKLLDQGKKVVENLMGGPPEKVGRDAYVLASPLQQVTKDAAPTLFLHGTADWTVPAISSELMDKKMTEAGAEAKLVLIEGAGHSFSGKAADKARAAALDFFDRHLKRR